MRYPNCNAGLFICNAVCHVCNTLRPQLPPAFNEARNKFIALQQAITQAKWIWGPLKRR